MDFNFFSSQENKDVSKEVFDDTKKVQEITEKLCQKRNALEITIATCEESSKEAYNLELLELKKAMSTFGISEIDYHIYIVNQKK